MRSTSKLVIVAVAFALGGLLAGMVVRGDSVKADSAAPAASVAAPTTTVVPEPTTTTVVTEPAPVQPSVQSTGTQSSRQSSSAKPSSPKPASNPTSGSQSNAPAPSITSFSTPENIDCHNGNFQMFTASWTTKNAVKVTISIDGAGVYKTYSANGEASLPFNCSSPHTFTLKAYNQDGHTVSRSITLQPRNVQPPETEDSEDEE